jgi:adenine-specific DNA-methyltransferase
MVKFHELIPVKSKSLTKKVSLHDNLIIHGDNLKALKSLVPLYAGKIKCIYIDPPYNTGNENWIYNDNVNSPMMQEWFGKEVDREDLTRHDKWLCMMMPRLKLLKDLLADDGVIFVSIDDNEIHRLRMLMDEIFGEDNLIESFCWKKSYGGGAKEKFVVRQHEYCLYYAKNKDMIDELWLPPNVKTEEKYYKYRDDKFAQRGPYRLKPLEATKSMDKRDNLVFPIKAPWGDEIWPKRQWWWSKDRVERALVSDEIVFTRTGRGVTISYKQYLLDEAGEKRGAKPFSIIDGIYTQEGTDDLRCLFEDKVVLQFPKPVRLIDLFLRLGAEKNSLILDSFAGSGPTAQAVLQLNKEDGGNRRFILVECEDYADSITAQRVRRVIKGVPTAKDESLKKGLGGTFSFFELGKPLELETILDGEDLPSYKELARYVFYTATGEEFDDKKVDQRKSFIGESRNYQVYLFYVPKVDVLKGMAFTLDNAKALPRLKEGKRRLVFAPTKYLDQDHLDRYRIDFAQLPFEIYELTR